MKFKRRANEDRVKLKRYIIAFALFLLSGVAITFLSGRLMSRNNSLPEPHGDLSSRFELTTNVEFHGEHYQLNNDITTILVMGIDQYTDDTSNRTLFRNGGQADFILVLVIDDEAKTVTAIPIDRDTITDITILGVLGNETGTRKTQICLAHGFGDGAEQSCELLKQAVSQFLLGIEIPYYVAMSMDGISELNDAIGGVTVTLEDDFSFLDPEMTAGKTLTLTGVQAEYFVRNRKDIGVGTNESRMARQKEYWCALRSCFSGDTGNEKSKSCIEAVLDHISPYIVTNIKQGRMINEIWKDKDYRQIENIHIEGQHKIASDGFIEFYADQNALEKLVTEIFFINTQNQYR